jgi:hypothetical protein
MQSISRATSTPLTYQKESESQLPLKKADTPAKQASTLPGVDKKTQLTKNDQPVSPAVILNISSTNVLVSSKGNIYPSNASWNKTI